MNDLLGEKFFIPAYQRGYRWTPRQVTDLLEDILTFQSESDGSKKETFYCLQPVVVMQRQEGDWELIDGQQRLTTLFLVLAYLKPLVDVLGKALYRLQYETRENSGEFLEALDLSRIDENIDYYHICRAYQTIEHWFEGKDGNRKLSFLQCLLNSDEDGRNVKVIWYELPSRENAVDVFVRLNMGKIPLTNAELIRALFLRSRNFDQGEVTLKQLQIAQEWDGIEKTMQFSDFWYFIYGGKHLYPTRIEYLFELITQEMDVPGLMKEDPYYTFIAYSRQFGDAGAEPDVEWRKVKQYFMTCEEWFRDRTLYHLVGYLITEGELLLDIKRWSRECGKSAFQRILREKAFRHLFNKDLSEFDDPAVLRDMLDETLSDLSYEGQSNKIRSVLLLFNIAALLQNVASNLRFPFDSYKTEQWDIEHIRSVKSDKPARRDDQKAWAQNVLVFWGRDGGAVTSEDGDADKAELCELIQSLLDAETMSNEAANALFDQIYSGVLAYFGEEDSSEVDHGLQNLALLDAGTNRSYKNAVFRIKRERIIGLDKEGTFVPLCTTNAFLKYYSSSIDKMMFWNVQDRQDYFTAIVDTLTVFFANRNGGAA